LDLTIVGHDDQDINPLRCRFISMLKPFRIFAAILGQIASG
jgi:hypothetical protein